MNSYEIQEYNISEWSCGMKGDYICWLDGQGQGYGLLHQYTGGGEEKYYRRNLHTNNMLFTLNN